MLEIRFVEKAARTENFLKNILKKSWIISYSMVSYFHAVFVLLKFYFLL